MWTDADRNYAAGPLPLEHEGFTRQIETGVLTGARWVDRFQSRFAPVAFAYAVFKKYADDEGSRLAALMAYYTFLSLFPLVIGGVAVLSQVLENRPDLVQEVIEDVVPAAYQDQILAAYEAGVEKRQVSPKAQEALAEYRAKKAAEKAAAEAAEATVGADE